MGEVVGTVNQIFQPKTGASGKMGPGAIVLGDGTKLKVWQRDMFKYVQGKTYKIEFKEGEYQGKLDLEAVGCTEVNGTAYGSRPATGKVAGYVKPDTSHAEHEAMLVRGGLCAAIHAGQVHVSDKTGMAEAMRNIVDASRMARSPQRADDMNDDIPY